MTRHMDPDWARDPLGTQCVIHSECAILLQAMGRVAPEAIALLGSWKGQHETYKWSDAGAVRFGRRRLAEYWTVERGCDAKMKFLRIKIATAPTHAKRDAPQGTT